MKTREQRIEAFINSLETVESAGCQSFLLTTDMSAIGGDNIKYCENASLDACGKTNDGECHNAVGYCGNAKNVGKCYNTDIATKPDNVSC